MKNKKFIGVNLNLLFSGAHSVEILDLLGKISLIICYITDEIEKNGNILSETLKSQEFITTGVDYRGSIYWNIQGLSATVNNICIHGIPEYPEEDLNKHVEQFMESGVGITISNENMSARKKVEKHNPELPKKGKPIILKLVTRKIKQQIMKNYNKFWNVLTTYRRTFSMESKAWE